jgi:diadenosine tetraphosphate (Ap4A) HIT family hydrolase
VLKTVLKLGCDLCDNVGGILLRETPEFRIVLVEGAEAQDYPGFCRVIWHNHLVEMTDLPKSAQIRLFSVVLAVEEIVREVFLPHKINLASLGNMTPHIHWHIIPRYTNDATFPSPIWANPKPKLGEVLTLNTPQTSYREKISLLQTRILALHFDFGA